IEIRTKEEDIETFCDLLVWFEPNFGENVYKPHYAKIIRRNNNTRKEIKQDAPKEKIITQEEKEDAPKEEIKTAEEEMKPKEEFRKRELDLKYNNSKKVKFLDEEIFRSITPKYGFLALQFNNDIIEGGCKSFALASPTM
ncbi:hypothetical protein CEXT_174961, partial [Caerostris extrusa]